MDNNGAMIYIAAAEEEYEGEAAKYNCDRFTIEKGEYLAEKIDWWRQKTGCIKDVFHKVMQNEKADKTKPAVEWYQSEAAMFCMVKTVATK